MLKAEIKRHILNFIIPGGTSRGILKSKRSWFIILYDDVNPDIRGVGECSIIDGLSIDDRPDYEIILQKICEDIERYTDLNNTIFDDYPSIGFGIETALLDLQNKGCKILFPSELTSGKDKLFINGLIWMGSPEYMSKQIINKVEEGYKCIKIKIGAIDFNEELALIREFRKKFSVSDMMIRVDANGAFSPEEAMNKLELLSEFDIHSIEQPIKAEQEEEMARLCRQSPVPIALDEELIGISGFAEKKQLLRSIKPQYIILKPSLIGGLAKSQEWISLAEKENIRWWVTSALESNIGLNAITQWTYTLKNNVYHGLGTGSLYENNIPSPLFTDGGRIGYDMTSSWDLKQILD